MNHAALIVVDVQRDFCPGGALAAPSAETILDTVNRHIAQATAQRMPVYLSRDWHPAVTTHFKQYGGEWPPHCVQGTRGADFHPRLVLPQEHVIISKGEDPSRPGYSAFDGHTENGESLLAHLQSHQIDHVYVAGLTTEYCVKQTALDALRSGLHVTVLIDAVAPIDARPGDADRALAEMREQGAEQATSIDEPRR